jgi:hypothetical protein
VNQEAWVEDKIDEVFAKKAKVEQADETRQNAESTLTTNTYANIIKNKIPNVYAKKGKFEKDDGKTLNAKYTPTINAKVNIDTRN